jgi:hypothetical protein
MEDFSKLNDRCVQARCYKDRWLALYKELYFYVIPDRDAFNIKFNYTDTGKPVTNQIWDNTAVLAAYQRANDLHGLLLPQDRVWGKLVMDPHFYPQNIIDTYAPAVEKMNDRIFFYLQESNLSRVVSSSNLDLVGGTGVIWVESKSDQDPLYYRSIPAVATYIEYSTDDLVNTAWYSSKQSGRYILETFPDYRGTIRGNLEDLPNDTWMINYGQVQVEENLWFMYAVLDSDPTEPLFWKYRRHPQLIIYRDRVRPGEAEGRGIGIDMLPTIRELNRTMEYCTKNLAMKAYPPMFYDAGSYFNPYVVRQWAGAMFARNPGERNPIEALQMPEYPDVFQQVVHRQEEIKKGFQVDPLGEIESPTKSATEVEYREARAQRTSATDISRLINEQPRQIYQTAAMILNERGLLLENRRVIHNFDIRKFKFEYQSPLFDIQKKENLNKLVSGLQVMQQYFGEGAAMAALDLNETKKFIQTQLGLPANLFASDAQLKRFLLTMKQMQQQAQLPQPSTTAAPAQLQQPTGVTI